MRTQGVLVVLSLLLAEPSERSLPVEVHAQRVATADIKIVFAKPLDVSPPYDGGLSKEARYPTSSAGEGAKDYGSLSQIVAQGISSIRVGWLDSNKFNSAEQADGLLREILTARNTNYSWHVWSWGDGRPSLTATVEHLRGKPGQLIVWCPAPALYWAYLDGNGKWRWGSSPRQSCSPLRSDPLPLASDLLPTSDF